MKILYVTANVLGDSGANAAEIFPRLSIGSSDVQHVYVADFEKNKTFVKDRQYAEFLSLRRKGILKSSLLNAIRIARKARQDDIDIIHVFYRQANIILTIFLRIALFFCWANAKIVMDHRSVNLARGLKGFRKKMANHFMQPFVHLLAGNPWAVETNYYFVHKQKEIIDLGYDQLPDGEPQEAKKNAPSVIWFIGSLRPRNRKSEFLIAVFERMREKLNGRTDVEIHVAGPARNKQVSALKANDVVKYHGKLPRSDLYGLLRDKPGVGVAFMNKEFHFYAPSLKFCEYAIMGFKIVASDTLGLQTQAERMNLDGVVFCDETIDSWADALLEAAKDWKGLQPKWQDAPLWSYTSIHERQVVGLYNAYA